MQEVRRVAKRGFQVVLVGPIDANGHYPVYAILNGRQTVAGGHETPGETISIRWFQYDCSTTSRYCASTCFSHISSGSLT